ncbi:MAG: hypothetical protein [Caudoviricetes sp.]|nr:MAG: hypothetical protein [Caudoviricetes sp.]
MIKIKKMIKVADVFFARNMQNCWYIVSALALANAIFGDDKISLIYSGVTYLIARSYEE